MNQHNRDYIPRFDPYSDPNYPQENIKSNFSDILIWIQKKEQNLFINDILKEKIIFTNEINNSFKTYFEPIPNYKDKDWIKNKERERIPFNIFLDQRTSKYDDDSVQAIKTANLDRFIDMAVAVLGKIWWDVFKEMFGQEFMPPDIKLFSWHETFVKDKLGRKTSVLSAVFYEPGTNTIHISREILGVINFMTTRESAIWLTLWLAHEFGHSIERQFSLASNSAKSEDFSDFVAGYSLKALKDMWLLGEDDLSASLDFFASIGTEWAGKGWSKRSHDTPEGRKWHLMRGYTSTEENLKKELSKLAFIGMGMSKKVLNMTLEDMMRILNIPHDTKKNSMLNTRAI